MTYDAVNDPYAKRLNAHIKRKEFERWKRTRDCRQWRRRQIGIQGGRCAYCRRRLARLVTHIDHVFPLYEGGQNIKSNYVLACKGCNIRKFVSVEARPEWIKQSESTGQRLNEFRRMQKELAIRELDTLALETHLAWLRYER